MNPKTILRHGRQYTATLIALALLWPASAFAAGPNKDGAPAHRPAPRA